MRKYIKMGISTFLALYAALFIFASLTALKSGGGGFFDVGDNLFIFLIPGNTPGNIVFVVALIIAILTPLVKFLLEKLDKIKLGQ
ncbi:MAG: hypothetical protein Q8R55_05750 [Candidatus Taylorbacteria bacterium]|nr:hypothetical protein [Candidatus Taylorbacteria bacterium]